MSYMLKEARESAAIVANQDTSSALALAETLKSAAPRGIVSVARGTSDHALGYLGYLLMHTRGMAVASLPPSLSSVLQTPWQVQDYLALGASQSGSPPDVIAMLKALAAGGARTATLVNVVPSPIIEASQHVLAVQAGPEKSVAATKSFIATVALARLLERRPQTARRAPSPAGQTGTRRERRLGSSGRSAYPARTAVRRRPRYRPLHRTRSGAEMQRNLPITRRSLLRRRSPTRADGHRP